MNNDTIRPVFIGGCPRSGTTMLGSLLGGHPATIAVPESQFKTLVIEKLGVAPREADPFDAVRVLAQERRFILWGIEMASLRLDTDPCHSYSDLIIRIIKDYKRRQNDLSSEVWIDHTPLNIRNVPMLIEMFPEAKFIHLVRDGRAVAASVMPLDWGPNTISATAHWWMELIAHGLAAETALPPSAIIRVNYENLVTDPSLTLRSICEHIGLDFHEDMLKGTGFTVPDFASHQNQLVGKCPDQTRIHAWQSRLSRAEVEVFEAITMGMLPLLGYNKRHSYGARNFSFSKRLLEGTRELLLRILNIRRRSKRERSHRQV